MFKFVLIFILIFPVPALSRQNFYDYIYRDQSQALYRQDTLSQNATQDDRQAEFLRRKKEAYASVLWQGVTPVFTVAAVYGVYHIWSRKDVLQGPMGAIPLNGLVFFVSNLLSGTIQSVIEPYTHTFQEYFTGVVNSGWRWVMGPPEDELQKLELKYVANRPLYSETAQKNIEWHFEKIRKRFSVNSMGVFSEQREDSGLIFLRNALGLPVKSQEIGFNATTMKALFAQYEAMMSGVPSKELEQFARALARSSKLDNPKLKAALYLEGPPGVGKTEAVEKLGQLLDVPVIKINLSEFREISELRGKASQFPEDSQCHPGEIARRLIGLNSKNAILFFDEADQALNRIHEGQNHPFVSMMLELLEGKTRSIYNPYFGFDIDVSHLGVILAGNSELKNKALVSRLNQVNFGNYTLEYRKRVGRERFIPEIVESYKGDFDLAQLTDTDWDQIDKMAEIEHKKLEEIGVDPGFRGQKRALEAFIHHKTLE